jgi:hypothetical protein
MRDYLPNRKVYRGQRMPFARNWAARSRSWTLLFFFSVGSEAALAGTTSDAEQKFYALTNNIQMGVNFDLLSIQGLSAGDKEQRENKAAELFKPTCVKQYTDTLQASVSAATDRAKKEGSLEPLTPLPDQARSGSYPNAGAACYESSIQKPAPFLGNYGALERRARPSRSGLSGRDDFDASRVGCSAR